MKWLNLYPAKTQLSALVDEAAAGAEIVTAKAGKPMAKLVPFRESAKRKPGRLKGKICSIRTPSSGGRPTTGACRARRGGRSARRVSCG